MRIVVQGDRVWVCGRGCRHWVKWQAPKFQLAVQSLTAHVLISNTCPEKHLCAGAQMHSHVLFACTTNGAWERIWASSVCAVFFGAHFLSKWYFSFVICSNQCHCAPLSLLLWMTALLCLPQMSLGTEKWLLHVVHFKGCHRLVSLSWTNFLVNWSNVFLPLEWRKHRKWRGSMCDHCS